MDPNKVISKKEAEEMAAIAAEEALDEDKDKETAYEEIYNLKVHDITLRELLLF